MKKITHVFLIAVFSFFLISTHGFSQSKLKQANKEFNDLSFFEAAKLYEQCLKDNSFEASQKEELLKNLAFSYRKLQDTKNSERVYAQIINDYPNVVSEVFLFYGQALSQNGKYKESQKYYAIYGEKQSNDIRAKRFAVSYLNINRFYKDSSLYKINFLPINSKQSDFSPMYYKGGLVFTSAREESGAFKRMFAWNKTPFLDLFFTADTSVLMNGVEAAASLGGASAANEDVTAEKTTENLTKVEVFSRTLNTKYHEGPMTFFKDEKKIVFTRNSPKEGKDDVTRIKLFTADLKEEKWINIKEVTFNSDEYSTGHPALNRDDSKMYFVSDMPGGYGGTDIYSVTYKDGIWGTPVNMGKEINTEGNEMYPYVDTKDNLYFASDGHEGLGGLDMFYAEMKQGVASRSIQNLGFPLNSEKDDFGIITDGERVNGYFSSNRKRGLADDNIYSFQRGAYRTLEIVVYDANSKTKMENVQVRMIVNGEPRDILLTPKDGKITINLETDAEYEFKLIKEGYQINSTKYSTKSVTSMKNELAFNMEAAKTTLVKGVIKSEVDGSPIAGVEVILENSKDKTTKSMITGADGSYEFEVLANSENNIIAKKAKYTSDKQAVGTIGLDEQGTTKVAAKLTLYGEDEVIKINNIYYDLGKNDIREDAVFELENTLIPVLIKNPEMRIEIRSHTDHTGSASFNQILSEKRAKAVVNYLASKGIGSERLSSRGFGESAPLVKCDGPVQCTEEELQKNRRTEFRIISVGGSE